VFAEWSAAKAAQFIDDLAACIVDTKIFPTSAVLIIEEWEKLNQNEKRFLTGGRYDPATEKWVRPGAPNRKYFWPFHLAIATPAAHCKPGLHVHYTFDLHKQFKNHAVDLYLLLKTDQTMTTRHRLGALDMELSEEAVGLQAADLFAYQTYQFSKQRIQHARPISFSDVPALLRKLLTNCLSDDDCPFFDRDGLNIALDNLPKHLRKSRLAARNIRKRQIA
jgi:hypothetical protein